MIKCDKQSKRNRMTFDLVIIKVFYTPINGTLSEVVGIDSATIFKKTVKERSIVTPILEYKNYCFFFVVFQIAQCK